LFKVIILIIKTSKNKSSKMSDTPKSKSSTSSSDSAEPEIEFLNTKQVEMLYDILIQKYNDVMDELEMYEMIDDDIQECREVTLDKYELELLAEAYDALGERTTAEGCRNQAAESAERIEELQANLENVDIKEHLYELYELEIRKETYECQIKACEKYLEKSKRKAYLESKRATIRPASPRRYPKAHSPSRIGNDAKPRTPDSPRSSNSRSSRSSTPRVSRKMPTPPSAPQNVLPLPLPSVSQTKSKRK